MKKENLSYEEKIKELQPQEKDYVLGLLDGILLSYKKQPDPDPPERIA